jgi:hypothetical protein
VPANLVRKAFVVRSWERGSIFCREMNWQSSSQEAGALRQSGKPPQLYVGYMHFYVVISSCVCSGRASVCLRDKSTPERRKSSYFRIYCRRTGEVCDRADRRDVRRIPWTLRYYRTDRSKRKKQKCQGAAGTDQSFARIGHRRRMKWIFDVLFYHFVVI